jgi:hypothetical protein
MYTVTSFPLLNRTRVIFRKAEFGFLGVMVLRALFQHRALGGVLLYNPIASN